ncbi:MAG TPA: tetratricopeptide repeat protein [Gemmatimonadota bacterium]|nr:tetratricopeptide repeat protein [Gemmatimonadota bacterium]
MKKDSWNYATAGLMALLMLPTGAYAQDGDCVDEGNRNTRSAEVEFSLAASRTDTRPQEERYKRALEKLEENWSMEEVPARSYLLAANAYLELRDLVGADSMLTTLVEIAPQCEDQAQRMRFNSWVDHFNAGIEALRQGDTPAALERFETANVINRDARSLAYAGQLYQQGGDQAKAIELYQMALDAGGEDQIVRTASINLATLKQQAGDVEGALEIYEDYSSANPDDVLGRLNFAIALMNAEREDEAQEIFSELMNRDDLTFNQWSQVGIGLYRAQNFARAAEAFERAYELNPHNKETLENLANSHYQAERYEQLLPLAEQLVERYPLERVPYNLVANSHRELGDSDRALELLERRDALPVEVLRSQITPMNGNVYSIDGEVMARAAEAGTTLSIPVTLVDEDGADVMTETLDITVPAEGEVAAFSLQVETDAPIAGFRYEAPAS